MTTTCIRPGCRKPMAATYTALQYPSNWRGPLCDRHAIMLHQEMDRRRNRARADISKCPICRPGHICCNHQHQLDMLGAVAPENMS